MCSVQIIGELKVDHKRDLRYHSNKQQYSKFWQGSQKLANNHWIFNDAITIKK